MKHDIQNFNQLALWFMFYDSQLGVIHLSIVIFLQLFYNPTISTYFTQNHQAQKEFTMKTRLTPAERENITVNELAGLIGYIIQQKILGNTPILPPDIHRHLHEEQHSESQQPFFEKFYEAIALLERRGLTMYYMRSFTSQFNKDRTQYLMLTSVGEKTDFSNEILILDDAQEIVNAFDKEISNPDPVVSQYYLESIRACQNDLCISSIICLGVASETVIPKFRPMRTGFYPRSRGHRSALLLSLIYLTRSTDALGNLTVSYR